MSIFPLKQICPSKCRAGGNGIYLIVQIVGPPRCFENNGRDNYENVNEVK